jgi:hypothetical protein
MLPLIGCSISQPILRDSPRRLSFKTEGFVQSSSPYDQLLVANMLWSTQTFFLKTSLASKYYSSMIVYDQNGIEEYR